MIKKVIAGATLRLPDSRDPAASEPESGVRR